MDKKSINKLGFMQGRFSKIENNKIQSFPWKNWRKDFRYLQKGKYENY